MVILRCISGWNTALGAFVENMKEQRNMRKCSTLRFCRILSRRKPGILGHDQIVFRVMATETPVKKTWQCKMDNVSTLMLQIPCEVRCLGSQNHLELKGNAFPIEREEFQFPCQFTKVDSITWMDKTHLTLAFNLGPLPFRVCSMDDVARGASKNIILLRFIANTQTTERCKSTNPYHHMVYHVWYVFFREAFAWHLHLRDPLVQIGSGPSRDPFARWVFLLVRLDMVMPMRRPKPKWSPWVEDVEDAGTRKQGTYLPKRCVDVSQRMKSSRTETKTSEITQNSKWQEFSVAKILQQWIWGLKYWETIIFDCIGWWFFVSYLLSLRILKTYKP